MAYVIFVSQSYFHRENKHRKILSDENFVGIYGLNRTPHLFIPYYKANNLPLLFGVVVQRSTPITLRLTPSSDRMCTSVCGDINQNLTAAQKQFLVVHQRNGHANVKWCQYLIRYHKQKTEREYIITETTIIDSKNPSVRICKPPLCMTCNIGKMNNYGVNYWTFNTISYKKIP